MPLSGGLRPTTVSGNDHSCGVTVPIRDSMNSLLMLCNEALSSLPPTSKLTTSTGTQIMIRIFQRLGCCNPSTDILKTEDSRVYVSGQERLDSNTATHGSHSFRNGTKHSKLASKSVAPQDSSADPVSQSLPSNSRAIEKSIGTTLQDAHRSSSSENTRVVPIEQQNINSRGTEYIDPEFHSDWSTTRVAAMFEKAHNFSIENAPITNIGHQQVNNVYNPGNYGLDNMKEFVSFSALHDSSAQDPERCCHPDTRKNVLHKMRTWMDDPDALERILWLHGPAGVGKSAIAQTISYSYGRDKVGATFFFFRSDPIRNDGNRLIPTLAWQLALSVPIVKDLIALSLKEYPDLPRKAIEAQFDQLITQPFLTISGGESAAPTSIRVVIIDGLDECSDVKLQRRILKIIERVIADTRFPLRFIISSRPEAHIEDFFAQLQYPTLQIDLANVDEAYRDIETYLTSEFARIAVEQELDPQVWPGRDIIVSFVSQSSGQFVYASTVIKYVGDEYESAVARLNVILGLKLWTGKSPFAELDALYTEILQRQPDQDFLREFLPVLVAHSTREGVEDRDLDDAMLLGLDEKELSRKLRGMHSLLKLKPFLNVHHKSFLDFLDDSSRSGEYHVSKHFANRRYMQLITDLLVKVASRAMEQADSHGSDHFKPKFAIVIKRFPLRIKLLLNDLEEILQPLLVIQENLLRLPEMSVPWKPRACDECWTFYMIDDLLLHLAWFQGTNQLQEPQYVGIRPLTATEEKQRIPQLDLDACLSLLLANLRSVELSQNVDTIGLVRALVRFDPTEAAMKVRAITDAQNLVELIFCLNKNECFKSWFGLASHNATRLAVAIYGRVPLLPRSLFLNSADFLGEMYQGKPVRFWSADPFVRRECFDAFIWGTLSHDNIAPFLGIYSKGSISLNSMNGTLNRWRQSTNPSVSTIQHIGFEVANAVQHVHSLGIIIRLDYSLDHVYLDSDNHAKLNNPCFRPNWLSDRWLEYDSYDGSFTLESNVRSFGHLFYQVLFFNDHVEIPEICPREPAIPDNVWQLIQRCCAKDPKERPTIGEVVQEMESWIPLGQFTLSS